MLPRVLTAIMLALSTLAAEVPLPELRIVERRRAVLETTRELMRRIEGGQAAGLKEWAASIPQPGRTNRTSQAVINIAAVRSLIAGTIARIESHSTADVLTALRASERALAGSKPP